MFGSQGGFSCTHLRKTMIEELDRRNYSESTKRAYVQTIEDLAPARFKHRFQTCAAAIKSLLDWG